MKMTVKFALVKIKYFKIVFNHVKGVFKDTLHEKLKIFINRSKHESIKLFKQK